jgi:uncharacterized membrane protein YsdA (DUF1294 family)
VLTCLADASFKILLSWLAAAGLIGFAAMGIDKGRAVFGEWRIPEMALFVESFVGGFWGVILGGVVFHHKTSKPEFMLVVFAGFVVWVVILQELGFLRCLTGAV